jgi:hypothetical protein
LLVWCSLLQRASLKATLVCQKDCLVGSRPKLTYAEKRIGIWALCDSRLSEWKESQGGPITADTEKASKIEDDNVR